jgi:hypothetical protein
MKNRCDVPDKMNHKTVLIAVFVLIVVSFTCGTFLYFRQDTRPIMERIRDESMHSIKTKHPEAAPFMKDLAWSGGRVTPPGLVGAETYEYKADGWTITHQIPSDP